MFKLVIEWGGPGTPINVQGPVNDKAVAYAMLELARDAVQEHVAKSNGPILRPTAAEERKVANG